MEILDRYDETHEFIIENGGINLKNYAGFDYWIEWSRLDSKEKVLHWVMHLLEKRWVDRRMMRKFIATVCDHHNFNPYGVA